MSTFHPLTVAEITKETPTAVSILFEVPEHLNTNYTFKAGQYLTLKTSIQGEDVRRAYSICSATSSKELRVAVKAVEKGLFSTYANRSLKKGDVLDVMPPEGKFSITINSQHKKNYCAFAAGSGITPILSMLTSVLENEPHSTFTLTYGNKSPEETIFFAQLNQLKEKFKERFNLIYIFSQVHSDAALFGRIDDSIVNFIVKNKYKHLAFDAYYLCGPEKMIDTASNTLKINGTSKNSIHYELFTSSASSENTSAVSDFEMASTKIIVDDEEFAVDILTDKLILDACLEENIDVPYSCQGGVCSSCIARVQEGEAYMVKNSILSDDEVKEGLILACQALAKTAKLVIDFDDV